MLNITIYTESDLYRLQYISFSTVQDFPNRYSHFYKCERTFVCFSKTRWLNLWRPLLHWHSSSSDCEFSFPLHKCQISTPEFPPHYIREEQTFGSCGMTVVRRNGKTEGGRRDKHVWKMKGRTGGGHPKVIFTWGAVGGFEREREGSLCLSNLMWILANEMRASANRRRQSARATKLRNNACFCRTCMQGRQWKEKNMKQGWNQKWRDY